MDEFSGSTNPAGNINTTNSPHYGYKPVRNNNFMILSLSMGILSLVTSSFIFLALPAAGLSILFAILSRGNDKKLQALPIAGIVTGLMGLILSVCITVYMFVFLINNPAYHDELNKTCEQMYGQTYDEMIQEFKDNASGSLSEQ